MARSTRTTRSKPSSTSPAASVSGQLFIPADAAERSLILQLAATGVLCETGARTALDALVANALIEWPRGDELRRLAYVTRASTVWRRARFTARGLQTVKALGAAVLSRAPLKAWQRVRDQPLWRLRLGLVDLDVGESEDRGVFEFGSTDAGGPGHWFVGTRAGAMVAAEIWAFIEVQRAEAVLQNQLVIQEPES